MLTRVNKIYDNGVIFFKLRIMIEDCLKKAMKNNKKKIILELKYGLLQEVQTL